MESVSSRELKVLEDACIDPVMVRAVHRANEFNELSRVIDDVSEGDVRAIVQSLDAEAIEFIGSPIRYSGSILIPSSSSKYGERRRVDELEGIYNGFFALKMPMEYEDEELGALIRFYHQVRCNAWQLWTEDDIPEGLKSDDIVYVAAELDGFMDSDTISPERARAWLEAYVPELIEEVDTRVLNEQSPYNSALMSLQGLDLNRYGDFSDKLLAKTTKIYLDSLLEYDKQVPYAVAMGGVGVYLFDDDGVYEREVETETTMPPVLAYIHGTKIVQTFGDYIEGARELAIDMTILRVESSQDGQRMHTQLEGLTAIESIRSSFYNN